MHRAEVLDRAKAAVGTRKDQYGSPTQNFERIARRWNAHLVNIGFVAYRDGRPIELTGTDVAMMLVDVKMARLEKDPTHTDSWVDVAGWAACGGEVSRAKDLLGAGECPCEMCKVNRAKFAPPVKLGDPPPQPYNPRDPFVWPRGL